MLVKTKFPLILFLFLMPISVQAGAELFSGAPTSFVLGPVSASKLFYGASGFQITVPDGATRLEIRLTFQNQDIEVSLYARFGEDIAQSGSIVQSDQSASGASNLL